MWHYIHLPTERIDALTDLWIFSTDVVSHYESIPLVATKCGMWSFIYQSRPSFAYSIQVWSYGGQYLKSVIMCAILPSIGCTNISPNLESCSISLSEAMITYGVYLQLPPVTCRPDNQVRQYYQNLVSCDYTLLSSTYVSITDISLL